VTNARAASKFEQRELKALSLLQDFQSGLDDRTAQVAVVIGTLV
jgi:hypothetical protein